MFDSAVHADLSCKLGVIYVLYKVLRESAVS
jgi:hypothetical protein